MNELILLHPKVIHFPIAWLYGGLLFEILFFFKKKEFYEKASFWLFHLGALSGVLAAISGLIASSIMGHDSVGHDKIHDHRNIMYIVLFLWFAAIILMRLFKKYKEKGKIIIIISYLVLVPLITWGADLGGKLVFKYGVGIQKSKIEPKHGDHHHD